MQSCNPAMILYNSLSEQKEKLEPEKNKPLRLFVCGPTVYDDAHIGHGRTYVIFDAFVKYLKSKKQKVFYLQNITDIDDKIISRARENNISHFALAKNFEKSYHADMKHLGVTSITKYARATKFIPEIVKQIQTLINKGCAYKIENQGWYFDISKFEDYGKLSKRTAEAAEDGISRIDESIGKRNKGDFCLWKFVQAQTYAEKNANSRRKQKHLQLATYNLQLVNGEPAWNTKLGWGRPGWHIEDTAISEKFFGSQYDLHGGGMDLKFPHHEAEITQQESASGKKPFVKIWMHIGLIRVGEKKMSKSLGNFTTIKEILKSHSPALFRWWILNHHYRSPIVYTEENLAQARESLQNIQDFINKLNFISQNRTTKKQKPNKLINQQTNKLLNTSDQNFTASLEDDFNTGEAIGHIFTLTNEINSIIWSLSKKDALSVLNFIAKNLQKLGLNLEKPSKIPAKIRQMAAKRELYRVRKQFMLSDTLRKDIERLGYRTEDTPIGPFLSKLQ